MVYNTISSGRSVHKYAGHKTAYPIGEMMQDRVSLIRLNSQFVQTDFSNFMVFGFENPNITFRIGEFE